MESLYDNFSILTDKNVRSADGPEDGDGEGHFVA